MLLVERNTQTQTQTKYRNLPLVCMRRILISAQVVVLPSQMESAHSRVSARTWRNIASAHPRASANAPFA